MPVFTTAFIAVSAAVAAASVATVAAAVVTVSMAIGVTGLAVTAVGLLTGNKDLLKAGKIMGYVGLAATVASLGANVAIEGFSQAMQNVAQGVGGAYSSAGDSISNFFTGGAQSGLLPTPPDVTAGFPADWGASVSGDMGGAGVMAPPPGTLGVDAVAGVGVPSGDISAAGGGTDVSANTAFPEGRAMTVSNTGSQPSPVTSFNDTTGISGHADGTFTNEAGKIIPPTAESGRFNAYSKELLPPDKSLLSGSLSPRLDLGIQPYATKAFDTSFLTTPTSPPMPDWMKYAGVTGSMQAGGGLLSGYLAGATAEEKLNFEKLKNEQDQAQRTNITNVRSAYAPQIQFQGGGPVIVPRAPAGLINA